MIDLYVLDTCQYCQKVMEFCTLNKIPYNKHEISNEINLEKLLKLGGKHQVPFLYDKERDVKMYESDDIISYLEKYYL